MVPADVSVLKTGQGLNRALQKLEAVRDNLVPEMAASDPHYLLKLMEAKGMTLVAEMYLRASLMRKESRCGHFPPRTIPRAQALPHGSSLITIMARYG